jgi:hypothetical protein
MTGSQDWPPLKVTLQEVRDNQFSEYQPLFLSLFLYSLNCVDPSIVTVVSSQNQKWEG